jgi:hypothetical protein
MGWLRSGFAPTSRERDASTSAVSVELRWLLGSHEAIQRYLRRCVISCGRMRHPNHEVPCLEYLRLRQHYEAAIRHWVHVLLSSDAHLVGALARQAGRDQAESLW